MNRETAKALLSKKVAASSEPTLGSEDLDLLLDTFGGEDSDSFDVETVERAAVEGLDWKLAAAAETYGRESDIYEHLKEERRRLVSKTAGGGAVVRAADTAAVKALL
jgi:hypothetical protein